MDDKNTILDLINNQFIEENIKIDKDTKELFASYLGEDRQVTLSEIEKAILLSGKDKTLTNKDILSYVEDSSATNIDELYDCTLSGILEDLSQFYLEYKAKGIIIISIIRVFIRQLQNLLALKTCPKIII